MKLEVGMYIRSPKGKIEKIDCLVRENNLVFPYTINCTARFKSDIKKASYDIIDLIEVGDYVNGNLVLEKVLYGDITGIKTFKNVYYSGDIKTVVTKEQFEDMEFKVLRMKYKIFCTHAIDTICFETNNKQDAIKKLKELEGKEYSEYLDYYQSCIDNYERPADFYPSYYIQYHDKLFNITDYYMLERIDD